MRETSSENHRQQKEEPSDGEGRRVRQGTDENKDSEKGIGMDRERNVVS